MKIFLKFIFILFLFLLCSYNSNNNNNNNIIVAQDIESNFTKCKISLLLSGDFNDLGYNFMMNDARIRTERILSIDSIYYKNLEVSTALAEWAIEDSIKQGANLIIVSSSIHTSLGLKYAEKYKDKDIYWFIRGKSRPNPDTLSKVTIFSFNSYVLHYALGYFSGLMSKSGVVGFVAPGPNIQTVSTDNSYYLGAKAANSSIKFVNIYTGSWLNPEVAYKASEFLMSNGADFIGMSQDDMSVQLAQMDAGNLGLGATGYPNSLVYGADVGISYVTNWTDVFVKYASQVIDGNWNAEIYSTSFAEGGSLFMDNYSYKVDSDVQQKVTAMIDKLKNDTYQPFRCDPLYIPLGVPMIDGCVNDTYFKASKILINNLNNVKDYGTYTIPIKFVDYPKSLKLGVTVVSGISILFCIVAMILVMLFRHAKIIRSASPAFLLLILLGCIIIFVSCIIFSQTPTDQTCSTRVWLLSVGFTIFLGNLLVKNWRIWLLFDNPKLKKRAITNWKLYPWVAGILAIDVLILGLWTGLGNIRAEPRRGIDGLSNYEYHDVCTNDHKGDVMLYILLVYHGLTLLMACFISFKIKAVDIEEFNESKPISTSVYLITFCLFIVIPLMISPQSNTSQTSIICICSIFVTLLSIIILFGSKFYKMATKGLALNETFATSTKSSSFSLSLEKEEKDDHIKEEEIKKSQSSSTHASRLAYFTSDDSDDDNNNNSSTQQQQQGDSNNNNNNINQKDNSSNNNNNKDLEKSTAALIANEQQQSQLEQSQTNNSDNNKNEIKEEDL